MTVCRSLCLTLAGCAALGSVALSPPDAHAARTCAPFVIADPGSDPGLRVSAVVERGTATCAVARGLLTDLYRGRGTPTGNGPGRPGSIIRGWTCGTGAGGAACFRGTSIDRATDRITAEVGVAPARPAVAVRRCADVIVRTPGGGVYARTRGGVLAVRTTCPVARRVARAVLDRDHGPQPLPRPLGFGCRLVSAGDDLRAVCTKGRQQVRWTFGPGLTQSER